MKTAKALVQVLQDEGIKYVFGNPGTTELVFLDALLRSQIQYIMCLCEGVAVGIADGYARASGKTGVLNLHTAPGLGNAMSLLYNAYHGKVPLVILVGQQDSRLLSHEPWLGADLLKEASPFIKWGQELQTPADAPRLIQNALRMARCPPQKPVMLSLPQDLLQCNIDFLICHPVSPSLYPPEIESVAAAARLLAGASSPIMVIGDGVARAKAVNEVVRLAELIGTPVYQPWIGQVNFPTSHPLHMGSLNVDSLETRRIFDRRDVMLAVGTPLFRQTFYLPEPLLPSDLRIIQIDDDPGITNDVYHIELPVLGDIKLSLSHLLSALENGMETGVSIKAEERSRIVGEEKKRSQASFMERVQKTSSHSIMSPARILLGLREVLEPGMVVVDDAITSTYLIRRLLEFDEPDTYFAMSGGGSLGWGLPGAVGIKLALPQKKVVSISGDGTAIFGIQALWTAAHHHLPVVFIILNNASYRILKLNIPRVLGGERPVLDGLMDIKAPSVDFTSLANGFGVRARRIEKPETLHEAFLEAASLDEPFLLEIMVSP